jgi:hypothetical protein
MDAISFVVMFRWVNDISETVDDNLDPQSFLPEDEELSDEGAELGDQID